MKKKEQAFTLVELIMVVVVLITISSIAIPNYLKAKKRAMQKEGISNVKLIAAAETIQRMEFIDYIDCNCSSAADCANSTGCNTLLKLSLNTANWTYTVVTAGITPSKTATITAVASSIGCTYTLASASFDGEPTGSGCS